MILVPVCVGLLALSAGASPWIAFVYLALAGVSQGLASPMMTALWAEIYGVESLGAIKGTVATFGIFATALGPLLLGGLMKAGVTFGVMVPAAALLGVALTVLGFWTRRLLLKRMTLVKYNPPKRAKTDCVDQPSAPEG